MTESTSATLDQISSTERFRGVPYELPPVVLSVPLDKSTWKPGIIGSNGGLVAAHDTDKPVALVAAQTDTADAFNGRGFVPGEANVPLSGSDQRGWRGGPLFWDVRRLQMNAAARQRGVKGREYQDDDGNNVRTTDPFDQGEFIDMSAVSEVTPLAKPVVVDPVERSDRLAANVGRFNTNNGVMVWVTPEGREQIAPDDPQRIKWLEDLGYTQSDINVPHSNGESFSDESERHQDVSRTWEEMIRVSNSLGAAALKS